MTTAPRPGNPRIESTLKSLREAGFTDPVHVFAEPGSPRPSCQQHWHEHAEKHGPWRNWRAGLRFLAEMNDADALYAMVQDDFVVRPGTAAYLDQTVKSNNVYSPYTAASELGRIGAKLAVEQGGQGWYYSAAGWWFCGALFFCFNMRVLHTLNHFLPETVERNMNIDAHVASVGGRNGVGVVVHRPSLVCHTGDDKDTGSTMGYRPGGAVRRAAGFVDAPL